MYIEFWGTIKSQFTLNAVHLVSGRHYSDRFERISNKARTQFIRNSNYSQEKTGSASLQPLCCFLRSYGDELHSFTSLRSASECVCVPASVYVSLYACVRTGLCVRVTVSMPRMPSIVVEFAFLKTLGLRLQICIHMHFAVC